LKTVVNCGEAQTERKEKIHTPEAMANKFMDQQSLTIGTAHPSLIKYPSQDPKGPVQVAFSDMSIGHKCSQSLHYQGG
jgi:hypothetical protein